MSNPAPAGERIVGGAVVNPPHTYPYQALIWVTFKDHTYVLKTGVKSIAVLIGLTSLKGVSSKIEGDIKVVPYQSKTLFKRNHCRGI